MGQFHFTPDGYLELMLSATAAATGTGARPEKADLFRRIAAALAPGGRFVLGDVVVPENPADALTPLNPGFDLPSRTDDQLSWLHGGGLDPAVAWSERDLAVIVARSTTPPASGAAG